MIRPRGTLQPLRSPQLRFEDSGIPRSGTFADSYFSRDGGAQETEHVFIDGSSLAQRLPAASRPLFTVGELGFGTGLNFLCTWSAFRRYAPGTARLHYWSVDAFPLRRDELEQALSLWPALNSMARELLAACPPPIPGVHRRVLDGGRITLDCVWADAGDALRDLASFQQSLVDAWYLDGFAPQRNPAMWDPDLFTDMAACSRPGATVASYSAAGSVRRGLEHAGFSIEKRAGFGSKRECISGSLTLTPAIATPPMTPWDLPRHARGAPPHRAVVLGAGLAGAQVAASLATRGVNVSVLDAGSIAGRASGNAQGVLFHRLSHQHALLSDFSLLAREYAVTRYRALFTDCTLSPGTDGDLNGCLQLARTQGDDGPLLKILGTLPELAEVLNRDAASEVLGTDPGAGGYFQHNAGWLSPPALCRALLGHSGVSVQVNCGPLTPHYLGDHWCAIDSDGTVRAEGDVLIIAAGMSSLTLPALSDWLPLKPVRGQTTEFPAGEFPTLRRALCHSGYIAPAAAGRYSVGATFSLGDDACDMRTEDHRENLAALAAALPAWKRNIDRLDPGTLGGHADLRATSPDYLPMVGPVPDRAAFIAQYAELGRDATLQLSDRASTISGLYLSTGYGSRGLSYSALGAEVLASQICGEIPPLARELMRALSPGRFLLRGIIRGAIGSKH